METELTAEELRILACLIEKSYTTPDQYPLTTNSLTNACNQKTSRDPVVDYQSQMVDQTMLELRQGGWARSVRGTGNRSFKHKHVVDEKLGVTNAELALLAVLALRGPQSPGELRTRTDRYGAFSSDGDEAFAEVEQTLATLAGREPPLVRNVGRESGQSQDRWIQLLGGGESQTESAPPSGGQERPSASEPGSPTSLAATSASAPTSASSTPTAATPSPIAAPTQPGTANELADLKTRLAQLEQRVADLEELL